MDIARLKRETSAEHDRVEASMTLMDANLALPTYVATLQRLYSFVAGWERWAALAPGATVQVLLRTRRRSTLLRADLEHFQADLPAPIYAGPMLSVTSEAQVLGAMYVMEGSTLGGQYIARHVETVLALTPGAGNSFFRGYRDATGSMWREIKDALTALPDAACDQTIAAAKTMFRDFGLWLESAAPLSADPLERSNA